MKTINWGVLGAARVNQRLLPAIENNQHSKILMLASRRNGAAEECVHQYAKNPEEIKTTTNFDEVINNPDINAIYIPLANEEHTEVALKSIAQGYKVCYYSGENSKEDLQTTIALQLYGVDGVVEKFHPGTKERVKVPTEDTNKRIKKGSAQYKWKE